MHPNSLNHQLVVHLPRALSILALLGPNVEVGVNAKDKSIIGSKVSF